MARGEFLNFVFGRVVVAPAVHAEVPEAGRRDACRRPDVTLPVSALILVDAIIGRFFAVRYSRYDLESRRVGSRVGPLLDLGGGCIRLVACRRGMQAAEDCQRDLIRVCKVRPRVLRIDDLKVSSEMFERVYLRVELVAGAFVANVDRLLIVVPVGVFLIRLYLVGEGERLVAVPDKRAAAVSIRVRLVVFYAIGEVSHGGVTPK